MIASKCYRVPNMEMKKKHFRNFFSSTSKYPRYFGYYRINVLDAVLFRDSINISKNSFLNLSSFCMIIYW